MDDSHDRIEKTVDLAAPVSRVWRALTDHDEFGTWFGADLDRAFEPGRRSRGRITTAGYEHLAFELVVTDLQPESLFAFSWRSAPEADTTREPATRVEFRLEPTAEGTRLTITESGFSALPDAQRRERLRSNTEGWDAQADNIAAHVQT